jgi:hypothetical protein
MARAPKPSDYKALLRLLAAAGGKGELNRWLEAAVSEPKPVRGAKRIETDERWLFHIELLVQTLERHGATRTEAIRQLVRDTGIRGRGTVEEASTVARLRRKLRDPKFQRMFKSTVTVKRYCPPASLTDLIRGNN